MQSDQDELVASIEHKQILRVVQRMLDDSTAKVESWRSEIPGSGAGGAIRRIAGCARTKTGEVPWSVILKKPRLDVGLGNAFGGDREPIVYRSRFLDRATCGLRPPRCFGITELEDSGHLIWIEDIREETAGRWHIDRYGNSAFRLGQFNFAFSTGRPKPAWPWLDGTDQLHDYVERFALSSEIIADTMHYWQANHHLPKATAESYKELHATRHYYLDSLDLVPKCIIHGDADWRNLIFTLDCGGYEELVAIDWAFAGLSVIGVDAQNLIVSAVLFSQVDIGEIKSLERIVYDNYILGLRQSGWSGDDKLVRLGFSASSALIWGVVLLGATMNNLRYEKYQKMYEKFLVLQRDIN